MTIAAVDMERFSVSEHALAEYDEKGFWISPKLFEDDEVEAIRTAVMRLIHGKRDTDAMHWKSPLPPV